MRICAVGDVHGTLDRMYDEVLSFERTLGISFDYVLHVGDFGVWPDPNRIDKATRRHDGAGDFARWYAASRPAPRKTIFVKGNHEDFDWLAAQRSDEILPGSFYPRNGQTVDLGTGRDRVRVGGIGGCYAPSDYPRRSDVLRGAEQSHYTRDEIETLGRRGGVDVLLLRDAPAGVRFAAGHTSAAEGLGELMRRLRPRASVFGHHHERVDVPGSTWCRGLNLIGRPGALVALELATRGELDEARRRSGPIPGPVTITRVTNTDQYRELARSLAGPHDAATLSETTLSGILAILHDDDDS